MSKQVVLVYYSVQARQRLEEELKPLCQEVYAIDGRASTAGDFIRKHQEHLIVLDSSPEDLSIAQAVRQLGQISPESLVVTVHPAQSPVHLYRGGHRVGVEPSLLAVLGEKTPCDQ